MTTDTDAAGDRSRGKRVVGRNALPGRRRTDAVSAFDPTVSAARCKVPSSTRDMPIRELNGRDTFRIQPAHGSDAMDKGENANPTGMVQKAGY